ncbi:MAG TPA: excinuclease ABC subunit UvrA [Ottowia sp.]|uniref:excinuclease ABC subunit UvrA n=1 Tax=Ottowia sp. TaxID=1898956 RepID=UPI002B5620B3|nr:excinuclease ABC subunit UvrA [Ottowia sp.]HMN20828.1 excinuclease ABC subunit UvrA [Ottowia sp.]
MNDLSARPTPAAATDGLPLAAALRRPVIAVRGARTHNLKNIDLDIPKERLVVITGLSGSGKSSLAFDTLYAEGQRRYVESLSSYARQFLQVMDKPDVDSIDGLSPAIAIEQKASSHNPRSTVGTVTEIHDYLRLLYARAGTPHCPEHDLPLTAQTVSQMVDATLALPEGTRLMILAPLVRARKGEHGELLARMQALGYVRLRIDGAIALADRLPALQKNDKHDIDVVIDRLRVRPDMKSRLADSFEAALRLADGRAIALEMDAPAGAGTAQDAPAQEHLFNSRFACPVCDYSLPELEPRLFSFNAPAGACPTCGGLGTTDVFDPQRVVAFPSLSLASGAIKGWDRRNADYYALIESLGEHYGFDPETPFEDLPERVREVILHGSGDEEIAFRYRLERRAGDARSVSKSHPFEGILPNMARRWRETDSAVVREELSRYRSQLPCPDCGGTRLRREARHVFIGEGAQRRAIYEISHVTLGEARAWFDQLRLSGARAEIAAKVVREIASRLKFLNDVGLSYLSLERRAETLSGGEAQRIRLASQIGSGLTGVMYVLDEPSIGLHQRDNDRLIGTLRHLRDLGNTVLVVEHDEDTMRAADHIIDLGPGAGVHGGRVMAQGTFDEVAATPHSVTGQFLRGERAIAVPRKRKPFPRQSAGAAATEPAPAGVLRVAGARGHNLRNLTVDFPVGLLTCVTGVSGSGKSTLVNDTLYTAAAREVHRAHAEPAPHEAIEGLARFDKVIAVDQAPIGRTPRSNPATYTGLFTPIRELMAETAMARERGYGPGRFSFNVPQSSGGGRCEACQGDGLLKVEMHFLPDVYVACDVCHGRRYNRETLEVQWKGRDIAQILDMTVEEAHAFFQDQPPIARKLQTLLDVGLSYITLGQSATTLSGGEAQRVKLALELSKRDTGRTLYVLDEPTTGLHFADIELLLKVLHQLRDAGNTIVVIEHNLDVIKTADWIIDLGPEGGDGGGRIVAQGTPEQVAATAGSHTGRYLQACLSGQAASS